MPNSASQRTSGREGLSDRFGCKGDCLGLRRQLQADPAAHFG